VPILVHPVPHFFVGFGPRVGHAWSNGQTGLQGLGDETYVDGEVVVGGWWGGKAPEVPAEEGPAQPAPEAVPARFGDAHQLVLTGELGTTLSGSTYTGRGGSSWNVSVQPSMEYFVANHVALGFGMTLGGGGASSQNVDGVAYATSDTQTAFAPHLGIELPLGRNASLFPRAWIGFEHDQNELRENGLDSKWSTDIVWVGIHAPLVFHVARHFFVGFGPYVDRDLTRSVTSGSGAGVPIPGTRAGASLLVGGWL
jgi:hypothetical protein